MPGVKGKSGGPREGAGRPPQNFRLTLAGRYLLKEQTPDGVLPARMAEVVEVSRSALTLEFDDGSKLTIYR